MSEASLLNSRTHLGRDYQKRSFSIAQLFTALPDALVKACEVYQRHCHIVFPSKNLIELLKTTSSGDSIAFFPEVFGQKFQVALVPIDQQDCDMGLHGSSLPCWLFNPVYFAGQNTT